MQIGAHISVIFTYEVSSIIGDMTHKQQHDNVCLHLTKPSFSENKTKNVYKNDNKILIKHFIIKLLFYFTFDMATCIDTPSYINVLYYRSTCVHAYMRQTCT